MTDLAVRMRSPSVAWEVSACATAWILAWAREGSIAETAFPNPQGHYEQQWALGSLTLAMAKLVNTPAAAPFRQECFAWLDRLVPTVMQHIERRERHPENRNNHSYWAGLAVFAHGLLLERPYEVSWGLDRYDLALEQVQDDGSLPLELRRGENAYIYHLFALQPLVLLGALGEAQGMDVYGRRGGRLALLADLVFRSFEAFDTFTALTPVPQRHEPSDFLEQNTKYLDWLEPAFFVWGQPEAGPHLLRFRERRIRLTNFRGAGNTTYLFGEEAVR